MSTRNFFDGAAFEGLESSERDDIGFRNWSSGSGAVIKGPDKLNRLTSIEFRNSFP